MRTPNRLSLIGLLTVAVCCPGPATAGAKPNVRVDATILSGKLAGLDDGSRALAGAMETCHDLALTADPSVRGHIRLDVVVDDDGNTKNVSRNPSWTVPEAVARCAESIVASAKWKKAPGDGEAKVLLSLFFEPAADEPDAGPTFHGYLQPSFGYKSRPDAVPRDRLEYGAYGSKAGFVVHGERFEDWHYTIHLVVDARAMAVLTDVDLVDRDGAGGPEGLDTTRRDVTGTMIEEISVRYQPWPFFGVTAGQMRIPFTVAHRSANTALMFPTRPGPNEVFLSGSDQGLLAEVNALQGRARASAGAFHGVSLLVASELRNTRGLVYSLRTDVEPFGRMPATENDFDRGPFRLGVGFGLLYRDARVYDATGYEARFVRDVRVSASLRAMLAGIYVQSEILRRLRTDNLSSRPEQTTGVYGQASYFLPVLDTMAVSPIARLGRTVEDETVEPSETWFLEGGLALYPAANRDRPDDLRLLLQYVGERRVSEQGENANGALGQISYRW